MITPALVAALSAELAGSDIAELELSGPGAYLRLRQDGAGIARLPPPLPAGVITAPAVGVFLDRHPLHAEPLAPPGTRVAAGTMLGLLAEGPLLLPVTAPHTGVIAAVLAVPGSAVGFGAPLFTLHPDG
jgi:acetyl-CoA carboxylase biotin carboxyl carrier protein